MTDGEWLTKVVHEKFFNNKCAAAAVEFEVGSIKLICVAPPGVIIDVQVISQKLFLAFTPNFSM